MHDQLLIDANGHMLFRGTYRKPIADLDPATLTFLNRAFAVDAHHAYALTDSGLLLCGEIDRDLVQPAGPYAVRVAKARFHVSSGQPKRMPLEDDGG